MRNLLKTLGRLAGGRPAAKAPARKRGDREAVVIAVAAQKGGVGKTTTSVNLASALARFHDQKVLLVDLDPQGHVSRALQGQLPEESGERTLSDILTAEQGDREVMDVCAPTAIPNLDVTPMDPGLGSAENLLAARIGKELVLRDALEVTRTFYDVIIIDCPPNLGNLSLNGLVAADLVLVPCDPSPLALAGVQAILETMQGVARLNPEVDLLGVLLTRVDGRTAALNAAVMEQIEQTCGELLLPVRVGVNSALAKAQNEGVDIFAYDASSRGAASYRELADHIHGLLRPDARPAAASG